MWTYGDYLRWLYKGGRPNVFARVQNRASALAFATAVAGEFLERCLFFTAVSKPRMPGGLPS